tara:strand:+ start:1686 stop:1913 length:228 start_codon:yes stop_codon:yes gene_type:complete
VKEYITIELEDDELSEVWHLAYKKYTEYQSRIDRGEFASVAPYQLRDAKTQCQFYKGIVSKLRKSMADPEKRRAS